MDPSDLWVTIYQQYVVAPAMLQKNYLSVHLQSKIFALRYTYFGIQ